VRYAFIHEQRERTDNIWPVRTMCRTLRVSRSGFYDFVRRLETPGLRARRRAALAEKITQVHAAHACANSCDSTAKSSTSKRSPKQ